jgi:hypothetical protein
METVWLVSRTGLFGGIFTIVFSNHEKAKTWVVEEKKEHPKDSFRIAEAQVN